MEYSRNDLVHQPSQSAIPSGRWASFLSTVFNFDAEETKLERWFGKAFELFILAVSVRYSWFWALQIQSFQVVVEPVGVGSHVDLSFLLGSPSAFVLAGLVTAVIVLGYTRRWRYGYFAAIILMHILFAARFSQGKIMHSSYLAAMAFLGIALAVSAFDTESVRRRFALGFTFLFCGLGYTFAGICKLVGTGLSWPNGQHLRMWIGEKAVDTYATHGAVDLNVIQNLVLDHYELATAILIVGLFTELVGFLMWRPCFRFPLLVGLLGLHVGIFLTMNIVFAVTTLVLCLLAIPALGFWTGHIGVSERLALLVCRRDRGQDSLGAPHTGSRFRKTGCASLLDCRFPPRPVHPMPVLLSYSCFRPRPSGRLRRLLR